MTPLILTNFPSSASTRAQQCQFLRWRGFIVGTLLVGTLLVQGCEPERRTRQLANSQAEDGGNEHLNAAIHQVTHLDEFEEASASPEIVYHIKQWANGRSPPSATWQRDPLCERLPAALRGKFTPEWTSDLDFHAYDVKHLQECYWFRDLSQWLRAAERDDALATWANSPGSKLSKEDAERLLLVERYFDWIVRNIQLDGLLTVPAEEQNVPAGTSAGPVGANVGGSVGGNVGVSAAGSGTGNNTAPTTMPDPLSLRGFPGPGYTYEPWQVLMYGHGDAWQRARLLILMARQQGIDVVMLATEDVRSVARPQPWLPAALIGDRLFLFDTALGLPIPDSSGQGIATLDEVIADPSLLSRLDVDEKLKYPVTAKELARVVAYIDASPLTVAQRMQWLESELTGPNRVVLTTAPSEFAERLRKTGLINTVHLWSVPWDAPLYLSSLGRVPPPDVSFMQSALAEQGMFQSLHPLVQGRHRQLRGMLEKQNDVEGAAGMYMRSRVPLNIIERLDKEPNFQRALGLVRGPNEKDADWSARIEAAKIVSRRAQNYASYWLGLVHYDLGNHRVSADWLDKLTLAIDPNGPWVASARYNLARAYEATGKIDEARSILLTDESPQRHGNILRARRIAKSKT